MQDNKKMNYNHYIAIDWSIEKAVVATSKSNGSKIEEKSFRGELKAIKEYISGKKGSKILTIEETTGSHWLYVELYETVDKIIICDPYRNRLLSEGAKTDKIDARKLCLLLRSGMLKEVYHSTDETYKIRKLVSSYEDLVKAGVRVKNQRSAIYRSLGRNHKKDTISKEEEILRFIENQQERAITIYEEEKKNYSALFNRLKKENKVIKELERVSGIGTISAVTIYAIVIDANRFENKYKYWAYCGLATYQKESGGKNYGRRSPRYCRALKRVYKTAAMAATGGNNDIREYYEHLIKNGNDYKTARNQIARYIAKVTYGIMKNGTQYQMYQWRKNI